MSVLVIAKFQGDTAAFRQALTDRAGEFQKIGHAARAAGGIHHRFGVGDGSWWQSTNGRASSTSSSSSATPNCRRSSALWALPRPRRK